MPDIWTIVNPLGGGITLTVYVCASAATEKTQANSKVRTR